MSEATAVIKTHQMLTRNTASRYLAQETVIPPGYLMISSGAFSGQNKIYTLKLPRDLISIKSKAFFSCQYLKEVCLPHSVQELGRDAFPSATASGRFISPTVWKESRTTASGGTIS